VAVARQEAVRMTNVVELTMLEALAETAYDRMYESSRPTRDFDNATHLFAQAIELALKLRLTGEAERLTARKAHIRAVYISQFRGFER
jgi:hypothetical protein